MSRVRRLKFFLWALTGLAAAVGTVRFLFGLGATTNLSDATPWGVWIGFDSEETTLINPVHTGATAALPVWINFMTKVSEISGYPKDDFTLSKNVSIKRLCGESYLLASPNCPDSTIYNEYFIPGTEINSFCNVHGTRIPGSDNSRFISDDLKKRR